MYLSDSEALARAFLERSTHVFVPEVAGPEVKQVFVSEVFALDSLDRLEEAFNPFWAWQILRMNLSKFLPRCGRLATPKHIHNSDERSGCANPAA